MRNTYNQWICPACVRRRWHVSPPALTPPESPVLPAARDNSIVRSTIAETDSAAPSVQHVAPSPNNETQRGASTPTHTSQRRSRNRQLSESTGCDTQQNHAMSLEGNTSDHGVPGGQAPLNSQEISRSTQRNRKSRFATLSSEVDASLSILYRELEAGASLKLQIEHLQQENAKNLQIINIRDQNLIALRRELDRQRVSDEEISRLRESAAQLELLKREVETLREENTTLEAELTRSREQATSANQLLNDWKGKLAQFIRD